MARYEGIDELLNRVRERLGVGSEGGERQETVEFVTAQDDYNDLLHRTLILLHDIEQLYDQLTISRMETLSSTQRADLLSLLAKVDQQLQNAWARLQRASTGLSVQPPM